MKIFLLSLLSGIFLSVSWPTYGVPFFIFIALVPLLIMEHKVSQSSSKIKSWRVFGLSYFAFLVWNIFTTGWLYNAQNPDGSPALVAVVFPVLVNSLLMSGTFQFYHWFKKKQDFRLSLVFFVAVWMSFEKFHLEWEFSWPWLNLGNVFAEYPKIIQWYDILGATGGSFWILLINVMIFFVLNSWFENKKNIQKIRLNVLTVLGIVFIPMVISLVKYYQFNEKPLGEVKVMMLQPNLDPYTEKYEKDSLRIVSELLNLAKNHQGKIDYYIAPETAFPGRGGLSEKGLYQSTSIQLIDSFLKRNPKSIFVGGVSTYKMLNEEDKTNTATFLPLYNLWIDNYNSAIQIIPNQYFHIYHKGKLVPGVEVFPYMSFLKPLLGEAMLDFGGTVVSLGIDQERKVFFNNYNIGKLAPIICYESIYGEYVTEYVKNGANFLSIMTNDSWWGVSQGHQQLLSYARLRAIETRREVARAANSGISAHIDARGEILAQTYYGKEDILISDIQLYEGKTVYVKIGDIISKICIFLLGLLCLIRILVKRKIKING